MAQKNESNSKKTLFVFDFDWTLVDDNTDTFIMSLCPHLELQKKLSTMRKEFDSWTKFMDHIFSVLHREGCSRDDIEHHMKKLRIYEEALKTVHYVHDSTEAESIIISDSNTVFIQLILEECKVAHMFKKVFTNPAHFEEDGRLRVRELVAHDCRICRHSPNICKSKVLKDYIASNDRYKSIVYVGDGRGDFCPASSLSEDDIVICRKRYKLAELLNMYPIKAGIREIDFTKYMCESVAACI